MVLSVRAEFQRFEDVSLIDIYDEVGAYVFWNANALSRPSYIGEGAILKRFTDHLGKPWARRPLLGVVAVVEEGTELERKWAGEFVELALLSVAADIDRFPTHNRAPGKTSGVRKLVQRHGDGHNSFRVLVSGYDPLRPPARSRMPKSKVISFEMDGDELVGVRHDWR